MDTTRTHRNLDDLFPLMTVRDGAVISKRGDVTLAWELTLPSVYSLTEADYDDMLSSLASAVKILPPWTLVHRQDAYTFEEYRQSESSGFLSQCYNRHFEGRRYLRHRSYLFLTCSSKSSALKPTASSALTSGIGKMLQAPSGESLVRFRHVGGEFISVLTSSGRIRARMLDSDELTGRGDDPGLIQSYMMLWSGDLVMSDILLGRDSVRIKDRTAIAYAISETDPLPPSIDSTRRVDNLSGATSELRISLGGAFGCSLPCEHTVNHYILTVGQSGEMQALDRKRRKMTSMSQTESNRVGAEEIALFQSDVQTDSLVTVRSHLNVIAWDTEENIPRLRGLMDAALSQLGISGVQETCDMPILWYAAIPGAGCELGQDNLMLMELRSAVALGIFESFERPMEGGRFSLCDRSRHIPLRLDFQESAMKEGLLGNMNAFILGASGTGKSFSMNAILRNLYDSGESLFIIDAGDSYEGLCSVIREESGGRDGFYYSWDRKRPLSFNPFLGFEQWTDEAGSLNMENTSVNFFLSFLKTCWSPRGGWSADSSTVLCQIISDFIASCRGGDAQVTMDDFYQYLANDVTDSIMRSEFKVGRLPVGPGRFDVVSFALALQPYSAQGIYGFLLNDRHPKDLLSSRFTVFEVDQLSQSDPKFYSLCILCIMNAFDVKMRSLGGTKVMVIEEAWKAIANETMAPYLAGLWKTARKFRTSAVVVTQQISDILSSEVIRDTILKNSDVRILLDQSGNRNRFAEIGDLLGLSPHERDLVLSINRDNDPSLLYKELFLSLGGKRSGVYAVEVSPEEAVAYESDKIKKRPFLELSAEKGSAVEAIREIVSRRRAR